MLPARSGCFACAVIGHTDEAPIPLMTSRRGIASRELGVVSYWLRIRKLSSPEWN
jgi:hypothetical protein